MLLLYESENMNDSTRKTGWRAQTTSALRYTILVGGRAYGTESEVESKPRRCWHEVIMDRSGVRSRCAVIYNEYNARARVVSMFCKSGGEVFAA